MRCDANSNPSASASNIALIRIPLPRRIRERIQKECQGDTFFPWRPTDVLSYYIVGGVAALCSGRVATGGDETSRNK